MGSECDSVKALDDWRGYCRKRCHRMVGKQAHELQQKAFNSQLSTCVGGCRENLVIYLHQFLFCIKIREMEMRFLKKKRKTTRHTMTETQGQIRNKTRVKRRKKTENYACMQFYTNNNIASIWIWIKSMNNMDRRTMLCSVLFCSIPFHFACIRFVRPSKHQGNEHANNVFKWL